MFHSNSFLPDWVLNIVSVKCNEEAKDGEEHDGVSCQNQATSSSRDLKYEHEILSCIEVFKAYHSGCCHVAGRHHVQSLGVHWGWCGGHIRVRSHGQRCPGQDDGQSEGGHHDASCEEVGELSAGIAGAVVTVSPGQQWGDGAEEVEHDHGEGIPVARENIALSRNIWTMFGNTYSYWGRAQARNRNNNPIDPVNARATRANEESVNYFPWINHLYQYLPLTPAMIATPVLSSVWQFSRVTKWITDQCACADGEPDRLVSSWPMRALHQIVSTNQRARSISVQWPTNQSSAQLPTANHCSRKVYFVTENRKLAALQSHSSRTFHQCNIKYFQTLFHVDSIENSNGWPKERVSTDHFYKPSPRRQLPLVHNQLVFKVWQKMPVMILSNPYFSPSMTVRVLELLEKILEIE